LVILYQDLLGSRKYKNTLDIYKKLFIYLISQLDYILIVLANNYCCNDLLYNLLTSYLFNILMIIWKKLLMPFWNM